MIKNFKRRLIITTTVCYSNDATYFYTRKIHWRLQIYKVVGNDKTISCICDISTYLSRIQKIMIKIGCRINFLKRCLKNSMTLNTIRNIKLPKYLKLPIIQCSLDYLHKFYIKKSLQHFHLPLQRHIDEDEKTLHKLSITTRFLFNTTLSAINQCYPNCVNYKKRLIKKCAWLPKNNQYWHNTRPADSEKNIICEYLIIYL